MKSSPLDSTVACARALGHPARLRILAMLQEGALCPCQLTEALQLASSTISAHLRELRRAGLTEERKEGRWVYVSLSSSEASHPWLELAQRTAADDPQVQADRELMAEMRQLPIEDLCRLGFEQSRAKHRTNRACSPCRRTAPASEEELP